MTTRLLLLLLHYNLHNYRQTVACSEAMADNEQKAHQLVEEARAKLRGTSSGFFSFIFGGSSKEEEGLEMMGRAANLYKMSKNWGKAGMLSLDKKRRNCCDE